MIFVGRCRPGGPPNAGFCIGFCGPFLSLRPSPGGQWPTPPVPPVMRGETYGSRPAPHFPWGLRPMPPNNPQQYEVAGAVTV